MEPAILTHRVALKALRQHRGRLLQLPHVVGVGVGRDEQGGLADQFLIKIFVDRNWNRAAGTLDDRIPRSLPVLVDASTRSVIRVPTCVEAVDEAEGDAD